MFYRPRKFKPHRTGSARPACSLLLQCERIQFLAGFGYLRKAQRFPIHVHLCEGVLLGNVFVGKRQPSGRIGLMLRVVQTRATRAAYDVDHALRVSAA